MNDEILILVSGSGSNREVANLAEILRRGGCTGKITFRKTTQAALKEAEVTIDGIERTNERHRNRAWR